MSQASIKHTLIFSVILFILVSCIQVLGLFEPWENLLYNWHFLARGPQAPVSNIVIVAIDDESIGWMGSWPWSRNSHAQLIQVLEKAGARLIAFDVLFDSPSSILDQGDVELAKTIQQSNLPIILSAMKTSSAQGVEIQRYPYKPFIKMQNYGYPEPYVDHDGFVRKIAILKQDETGLRESFAYRIWRELEPDLNLNQKTSELKWQGKLVPTFDNNKLLINYAGPASSYPTVPFDQVVDGSFVRRNPDFFKDKIVFVGATALILQDLFYTPFYNFQGQKTRTPGVEVQANILGTLLSGKHILLVSPVYQYLLLFILILISTIIYSRLRVFAGFGVLIGITILLLFISSYLFNSKLLWMTNLTSLLVGLFLSYFVLSFERYLREEREKKRIRSIFSRYVAPNVVNELLLNKESLKLGGEKKEITVLFSDIRNFTSYSESHSPEEVVAQLNEYLEAMTEVIFKYQGTLDKYIGDEIMAIWGAPIAQEDHAQRAVDCAVAQIKRLSELQTKWETEGKQLLNIGIGINTGEVIVGNIGSSNHMDYTVIGDAVNLGARLEAETRKHGTAEKPCHIIIGETTYQSIKETNKHKIKTLGKVTVKGKFKEVNIYEILVE